MASSIIRDRKSTRLNSSHAEIYTLSLHDALPIYALTAGRAGVRMPTGCAAVKQPLPHGRGSDGVVDHTRSEEHTSELQSRRDLHSFPTRRSSDLRLDCRAGRSPHADRVCGREATPPSRSGL